MREVFNPLWGIAVGSSIGMSATIDKLLPRSILLSCTFSLPLCPGNESSILKNIVRQHNNGDLPMPARSQWGGSR